AGQSEMRLDARFGKQCAGARFPHGDMILGRLQSREASANFRSREKFMLKVMLTCAAQGAWDDHPVLRPDHEAAGLLEKQAIGKLLQFSPQFIRALHERHVERMLEISFTNDACLAMR